MPEQVSLHFRIETFLGVLTVSNIEPFALNAWIASTIQNLNLAAPLVAAPSIKTALTTHLADRLRRVLPRLENPDDSQGLLKLVLLTDVLIQLQGDNEPITIALHLTSNPRLADQAQKHILSAEFQKVRQDLGIRYHWTILIPGFPLLPAPIQSEFLDALYRNLDDPSQQDILSFGVGTAIPVGSL
jgi:hypothetical protein